jgi:hypothetical protein
MGIIMEKNQIKRIIRAKIRSDKNRLDDLENKTVKTKGGHDIACEEAVLTWRDYNPQKRKELSSLSDLEIVAKIYSTDFDYLKPNEQLTLK